MTFAKSVDTSRPSSSTCPCVGRLNPVSVLTQVVLPAPFGSSHDLPLPHLKRHILGGLEAAEGDPQGVQFKRHFRRSRQRARRYAWLQHSGQLSAHSPRCMLGRQVIEVLALALDDSIGEEASIKTAVLAGHLRRAKQIIR